MIQDNLFAVQEEKEFVPDNTEIVQVLMYYSKEEAVDFKRLCKIGMKKEFPNDYIEKGNVSDFVLRVLKKYYAND